MSEPQNHAVRSEEPELIDEAIEQVAGGCQVGCSADSRMMTIGTIGTIDTNSAISQAPTFDAAKP